ncbi:hypothetical protein [Paenibacillus turpanensis]|uniref:hypothetical protein n=1 Tax=Paenibacillus turpanensis TaxID=2689078 RepID=UPI0014085767|nr:hypothetical protein [Paenibacillus turpanensis]
MKPKRSSFGHWMLAIVLLYTGAAVLVFVQPEYRAQPSMKDMLSMAMMMWFGHTMMNSFHTLTPMIEVCMRMCEELTGMDMHMHMSGMANPVLDPINYVLSLLLVVVTAVFTGTCIVWVILWLPRTDRKGRGKGGLRK